jgi:predicted MFS family arabinose efflux permease
MLTNFSGVLIWFMVHEVGRGVFRPLKKGYLNRRIETDKRATILSFDSMINQVGCGLGLVISGVLAEGWSMKTAWLVSAIMVIVAIPVFYYLKNGDGKKK